MQNEFLLTAKNEFAIREFVTKRQLLKNYQVSKGDKHTHCNSIVAV